jgi:hypothetical protein
MVDMSKRAAKELDGMVSRHSKRLRFAAAIKEGMNTTQAARAAGITRQTGAVWRRQIEGGEFDSKATRGAVLTKQETAELVAGIARDEGESAAYRINAMSLSADLGGHKAPTRSVVDVRTTPHSVIGWLDSTYGQLAPATARAELPPGDPPTDVVDTVLTPQTNSTNSGETVDAVSEVVEPTKDEKEKE